MFPTNNRNHRDYHNYYILSTTFNKYQPQCAQCVVAKPWDYFQQIPIMNLVNDANYVDNDEMIIMTGAP